MRFTMETERAFERELPGGGFVAIEVFPETSLLGRAFYRGVIVVERRPAWLRWRHEPPVIAAACGATAAAVLQQLLPAAESNVAVAAGLLKLDPVLAGS
ncbi:MAG: hypothetical protein ACREPM_09425 [Gemmatimonadaceae bacterium]